MSDPVGQDDGFVRAGTCPYCGFVLPEDDAYAHCVHLIANYADGSNDDGGMLTEDSRAGTEPLRGLPDLVDRLAHVVRVAWGVGADFDPIETDGPPFEPADADRLRALLLPTLSEWGLDEVLSCIDKSELPSFRSLTSLEDIIKRCPGLIITAREEGADWIGSAWVTFLWAKEPGEGSACIAETVARLTRSLDAAGAALEAAGWGLKNP